MKKLIFVILISLISYLTINAQNQWIGSVPGPIYYDQGNVGIGNTSPQVKLHITTGINALPATSGNIQTGGALRVQGGDNAVIDFGTYSTTTWVQATDKLALGNGFQLCLNPNGGNVGIGNTSPQVKLHIKSGINALPATSGNIQTGGALRVQGGDNAVIDFGTYSTTTWVQATDKLALGNGYQLCLNPNGGNVGIGTSNPAGILEIRSSIPLLHINGTATSGLRGLVYQLNGSSFAFQRADANSGEFRQEIGTSSGWGGFYTIYTDAVERIRINKDGNIGIGTSNPSGIFEVKSNIPIMYINGTTTSGLRGMAYQQNGESFAYLRADANSGEFRQEIGLSSGWGGFYTIYTDATERMRVNKDGNIGIGTSSPGYKLDVCGTIRAKEVKVDLAGNCGADFVFKNDYKLLDLKKLEEFVKINQHLPEIAPEKEMVENGVNMNELQMKLLQKIEELTLYTIELNKRLDQKDEELKELNAKIESISEMK